MKDSSNTAKKLLDLPYAPEAEQYLDELERSGQFRIGLEAEVEDAEIVEAAASNDYAWGRGSGSVSIQDWWTTGRVALRVGPGIAPADIMLSASTIHWCCARRTDWTAWCSRDISGLIPDASTLRIIFSDGSEWAGAELLARITSWLARSRPVDSSPASDSQYGSKATQRERSPSSVSISAVQNPRRCRTGSQRTRSAGIVSLAHCRLEQRLECWMLLVEILDGLGALADLLELRFVGRKETRPQCSSFPAIDWNSASCCSACGTWIATKRGPSSGSDPRMRGSRAAASSLSLMSRAGDDFEAVLLNATYTGRVPATMNTP